MRCSLVTSRPALLGFLAAVWLAVAGLAPVAQAEPQLSARLGWGFGSTLAPPGESGFQWATSVRSELLFGAPGDGAWRLGPAVELRSARWRNLEVGAGAGLLVPVLRGYPLVLTVLGSVEALGEWAGTPRAVATLAWGYRSYDHGGLYAFAAQLFVSGRVDVAEPAGGAGRRVELLAGLEIDFELLALGPLVLAGKLQGPAIESQ